MKRYYSLLLITLFLVFGLCPGLFSQNADNNKKGTDSTKTPAKIETKKGGSASAGNHQVSANGSKGGCIKIDKSGMKIQGKKGGKVEIGKKEKQPATQ